MLCRVAVSFSRELNDWLWVVNYPHDMHRFMQYCHIYTNCIVGSKGRFAGDMTRF